jgi:TatD DNase family protein
MIDLHCHLDLYPKPAPIIAEIRARGMYVLAVTTTPEAFDGNLRYVGDSPRIRVAVGLHPELAKERHAEVRLLCAALPRTRYVGEVGLDGSPQHRSSLDVQRKVLRTILDSCRDHGGRIVSLHSRMAADAVLDEIESAGSLGTPVMHWFSGSPEELARAKDLGCWFSIGPAMLSSRKGRLLAAEMPRDRVLPETDGPFGQLDGKALMPWESCLVEEALSRLWGIPVTEVEKLMESNLRRLVN